MVDVLSIEVSDPVRINTRSSKGGCWLNELLSEFSPHNTCNLDAAFLSLPAAMRRSCVIDVLNLQRCLSFE